MNTTLNYLVEANFGLLLFFVAYRLWLSNETQFAYRRYYLLGSMVLSLLFPLIKLPELKAVPSLSEAIPLNFVTAKRFEHGPNLPLYYTFYSRLFVGYRFFIAPFKLPGHQAFSTGL